MWPTLSLRAKNVRIRHGGQLLQTPIKKLHFYLECLEEFLPSPAD
jgi:hypothetical protein